MADCNLSLAFSTYSASKLFLVGRKSDGRLAGFERTFERTMGLWSNGQTLWLSSAYQLWRLENILAADELSEGYDRLYVPQVGYTTGDIDIHDVAGAADGRVVFVSTLFSCLATCSERFSFEPLWKPPFISKLAAEDRCHLNGLAMRDGRPRYVTACGQSDVVDGWRDHRNGAGCVIDVESNEIVCTGLSMPHSPRWHNDRLWLLDSGTGYLGFLRQDSGEFERVAFCPGYARGLTFVDHYAIVGLSKCRRERTFSGLSLDSELSRRQADPRCGLLVIDTHTGDAVHWLRLEGAIEELYDVVVLPNASRPKALGFKSDEIRHHVWYGENGIPNCWRSVDRPDPS